MNRFEGLFSPEELAALKELLEGGLVDLSIFGWGDTYSLVAPDEEGFVNIQVGRLPPLHIDSSLPMKGGRKAFNKLSQRLRKQIQGGERRPACTPFIMQRVSLYGGWLLQEGFLQFHGTLRLGGEKIPLHFWFRKGVIILPKVKLKSEAQYRACVEAGLI
jgi:hypothetical protein